MHRSCEGLGEDQSGVGVVLLKCAGRRWSKGRVWKCEGWGDWSCMDGFTAV